MHVEFRLSEVAHVCAFDPESFYRMKQAICQRSKVGNGVSSEVANLLSLSSISDKARSQRSASRASNDRRGERDPGISKELFSSRWKPELRVQFVFERLIKLESTDLTASAERTQHEKQVETNWDGSEIRTKRYSVAPREVILAALPESIADCVVKIRLLQLPPDLGSQVADRLVERAIGVAPGDGEKLYECRRENPICIGVAKITLRELMTVRGGVCIALQPKNSIVHTVEDLNLNTVATKGMFGKDVGGSAFLTFQVIAFSFGKVSPSKLLLYKERRSSRSKSIMDASSRGVERSHDGSQFGDYDNAEDPGSVSRQVSHQYMTQDNASSYRSSRVASPPPVPVGGGTETGLTSPRDPFDYNSTKLSSTSEIAVGRFDSAAVRFVLVPYITMVDTVLKVHDVLVWRRPMKTAIVLAMGVLAVAADAMDIAFFFLAFCLSASALQTISLLYRVPVTDQGAGPLTAALTSENSGDETGVFLYGRHNAMLNALVRARLFFTQGLQEESYYEMVLIFHTIRRNQREILLYAALLCLSMCIFSADTLLLVGIAALCVFHPLSVRIAAIRPRKNKRKNLPLLTLYAIAKGWKLNAPMRVVRVVRVMQAGSVPAQQEVPQLNLPERSVVDINFPPVYSNKSRAPSELNSPLPEGRSEFSAAFGGASASPRRPRGAHARAHTIGDDYFAMLAAVERRQCHNASWMSFAVVTLTCESTSMMNNKANPCAPLLEKLHRQFQQIRQLRGDPEATGVHLRGDTQSTIGEFSSNNVNGGGQGEFPGRYTRTQSGMSGGQKSALIREHFVDTLNLLTFISRNCSVQAFVSPGATSSASLNRAAASQSTTDDSTPLAVIAQPRWLVECSEEDGITATLCAMNKNTLSVKKLPRIAGVANDARALALLGAYLLRGCCLSVYSSGSGSRSCSIIFPLESNSTRFRPGRYPSLCPRRLMQALEEIWQGSVSGGGTGGSSGLVIDMNVVLQIISACKEEKNMRGSWGDTSPTTDVSPSQSPQQSHQPMKFDAASKEHTKRFLQAITTPFMGTGNPNSQRMQGNAYGANKTPTTAASGNSPLYGALGVSRETSVPSFGAGRENLHYWQSSKQGSSPQQTKRTAASTPMVRSTPHKATPLEEAPLPPPEMSRQTSMDPPDLAQTHRGGGHNVTSRPSTSSRTTIPKAASAEAPTRTAR